MKTDIFLGIDMGSTSLKVVAFESGTGRVLASGGGSLPFRHPAAGACERSDSAISAALKSALAETATRLGSRVSQVRAIGCTGHGAGLFALDAKGGLLGGVSVGSIDQRGAARAQAIAARYGDTLIEEVGTRPWAGQPTVLAAQLHGDDAVRRGALQHILFAKDYLCFLLSGELVTDVSDASTAGLITLSNGAWSSAAFEASGLYGLGASNFPPLVPSGTVIGRLRQPWARECGLPSGLPVCTSGIDLLASMHAVQASRTHSVVAVMGTWSVNAVVGAALPKRPAVAAVVHIGDAHHRLYMDNSPSGMANLSWLAGACQWPSTASVFDAAFRVPMTHAPQYLPFLHGAPPGPVAGFLGLQPQHGCDHLARGVVNAVAALHARHLAQLRAAGLDTSGRVIAVGGGARDARMVRLLATFLGHAVQRCDDESGARGAALCAAISQSLDANTLPVSLESIAPAADEEEAAARYLKGFDKLIDTLAPAFAQLAVGAQA